MSIGRRLAVTAGLLVIIAAAPRPQRAPERALPQGAERAYAALASRVDPRAAMDVVEFLSRSWRIAGNPGYDASIDHIRAGLAQAGYSEGGAVASVGRLRVDEFANQNPGWDYSVGTVTIAGEPAEVVLSRERDRVSLAINSFPTPEGGLAAPLVDVGAGAPAGFEGKDLKGAVVLGDAPLGRLWQQAVKARGAAGVISTAIAPYIRPSDPSAFTRDEQQDVLQWGGVPYDPEARAFGFKASWRAASRLRERLRQGPVTVRVDIRATFHSKPNRTLAAEIPGRTRPDERIVMAAHVQEPGANDNASGCGSLYALARALADAIAAGGLPPPDRTLTFLWLDEIRGSRQWLTSRPEEARGVQYMFALDMTGEDTTRTGGTYLIEKQPDPSAVWPRPSDPHTEWGASEVKAESLKGSLLNDLQLAVSQRRARDTGWVVRTNPYEGGSDHTVFGEAGIPSLLTWHFTDRYYHTNQDTPDKVSADEMRHVAVTVATSAWLLASADESDALGVLDLLESAAASRLALERRQGADLIAAASDRAAAERLERQVLAAWVKWYGEAFESVLWLPVRGPSGGLKARVAQARERLEGAGR